MAGGGIAFWSPPRVTEGWQVAAGLGSGKVVVLKARTLKPVLERKDRKGPVSALRYSGSGKLLAAGGAEGFIDLYDVASDYDWVGTCSGHKGPVRDVDWSVDRLCPRALPASWIPSQCIQHENETRCRPTVVRTACPMAPIRVNIAP